MRPKFDRGEPTIHVEGDLVIGYDPGAGPEYQAEVAMRRLPDGRVEIVSVKSWPVGSPSEGSGSDG